MEQIGQYKILRRLGGGGFGEVWLGEDALRQVAIKIFNPKDENLIAHATSSDTEGLDVLRKRFVNEARILVQLEDNPHIVNVLEFGELEGGFPYYVMPYLPRSLADLLGKDVFDALAIAELTKADQPRAIELSKALHYLLQTLKGLSAAHSKGLVHRDIKPSNIMLSRNGQIRIVDFGIAKAPDGQDSTMTQLAMGSRHYMAPEQRESAKHVDARADIYAVGTVAYRMLTGHLPIGRFADPNVYSPALPQAVNDLLLSCLSESREGRPADGADLLRKFIAARQQPEPVDEDDSGTWIGRSGESRLRNELKPLNDEIDVLLQEHVVIDEQQREKLEWMSAVIELDNDGLDELIKIKESEMGPSLRLKRNFLRLLDETVSRKLTSERREMLHKSAVPTGWNSRYVDQLISKRQLGFLTVEMEAENGSSKSSRGNPGSGLVVADAKGKSAKASIGRRLVFLGLLIASGSYGYITYENELAALWQDKDDWLLKIQQEFLSVTAAENHDTGIEVPLETGTVTDEQDSGTDADWLMVRSAQRELNRLGYPVGRADGAMGSRTLAAVLAFQKKESLAQTGRVSADLVKILKAKLLTEFTDCNDCPSMVVIPAGTFQMGSKQGRSNEKPVHPVTIRKPFALGKYEVTFAEYDVFAKATSRKLPDSEGWGRGTRPVMNISWLDAKAYVTWLSRKTRRTFRLPTESEWEYAARAGTESKFSWGDKIGRNHANCDGCGTRWDNKKTAPVGEFEPNAFGLYDMHGNVWEWVEDCYKDSYWLVPDQGSANTRGYCNYRVLRGGSWYLNPSDLRSANRSRTEPAKRSPYYGFRVARDLK
jgi:serine/threonine-protein kinase